MAIGFIQIPVLAASGLTTADEKTGLRVPLTEGKIQLQCDGAEGYFQDVMIESIDHLPQVQVAHWAIEVSDLRRIWLRQHQTYMIAVPSTTWTATDCLRRYLRGTGKTR